jgi:secondary thiamine-phosphate synthase enzyme
VRDDLAAFFSRLAPEDPQPHAHDDEGPDDMLAHLRAGLTGAQLSISLIGGRLALGTWQNIYSNIDGAARGRSRPTCSGAEFGPLC